MSAIAVPAPRRFWEKVVDVGDCWLWSGHLRQGYGTFWDGTRKVQAHRFAYEAVVGPLTNGMQIDHLCRNRGCVNPSHIEPVSPTENIRRGMAGINTRAKTHCPSGHEYTEANVQRLPSRPGTRYCRECKRLRRHPR